MKVLVACEYSGVVREAFRAKGHEAYSCDILPAEDNSEFHIQADIREMTGPSARKFDLMIAHPPCTYLANSGWWRSLVDEERMEKSKKALEFFLRLWSAHVPKICIENPVPGTLLRDSVGPATQYIQPYYFGDDASKKTGLWLKNLPALSIPPQDEWYPPRIVGGLKRWSNQTDSGQNRLGPSSTRGKDRSRTYQGIANAMAEAWG